MNEKGVDLDGALDWVAEYHEQVLEADLFHPRDRLLGVRDRAIFWDSRSGGPEQESSLSPAENRGRNAHDGVSLQRVRYLNISR